MKVNFTGRGGEHKPRTVVSNVKRNAGNGDTVHRSWGVKPQGNRTDQYGFNMGGPSRPGRSTRP